MTGTAKGKLILTGEHAILYGAPALGVSLPWEMQTFITLSPKSPHETDKLPQKLKAFESWIKENFPTDLPREWEFLKVNSPIPQGGGFGSSAALCVSTVKALLPEDTPPDRVWELAHRLEYYFHGTPSGLDTALSLFGGLQQLKSGPSHSPPLERHSLRGSPFVLLADWVPKAAGTRESICRLKREMENPGSLAAGLMKDLVTLAEETCSLFFTPPAGDFAEFSRLLNLTHLVLNRLGLGNQEQNDWIEKGRARGASAGKLSGSGKGGAYFLLCESEEVARSIKEDFYKRWNRKLCLIRTEEEDLFSS